MRARVRPRVCAALLFSSVVIAISAFVGVGRTGGCVSCAVCVVSAGSWDLNCRVADLFHWVINAARLTLLEYENECQLCDV